MIIFMTHPFNLPQAYPTADWAISNMLHVQRNVATG
jgi:hypothetical protein